MHWINHITLHRKDRWQGLFPFELPDLIKWIFKASHFKNQCTKPFRNIQNTGFKITLNKVLEQHRQQDRKIAIHLFKHKIVKFFCFQKLFKNQKIIIYWVYWLNTSIVGIIRSVWKKGRGPDSINSFLRCTVSLIQSPSW